MKIRKNLEAVFLAAVAIVTLTTSVGASVPAPKQAQFKPVAAESKMQVVTVSHKRLSAAEKAKLN